MYNSHWGFQFTPFSDMADRRQYVPLPSHEEAMLRLSYSIEERKGVALLLGETGVGKSFLIRTLVADLESIKHRVVTVQFPQMLPAEVLAYIAAELGSESADSQETISLDRIVRELEKQIAYQSLQGRSTVIVIEEAHLIDNAAVFETVRMLLNLRSTLESPVTLVFVGQPELAVKVSRIAPLADRLASRCLLTPLTLSETQNYIQHRLTAAGTQREVFHRDSLELIQTYSGGIPRRINRLCDLSLLLAYANECDVVSQSHIETAAAEFAPTDRRRAA